MARIILDGQTSFKERSLQEIVDLIPAGVVFPFAGNGSIPKGYLLCDGSSLLRTDYSDLFTMIGTIYGAVDNLHFSLPDYTGRFLEGSNTAGTKIEAGLPNITGTMHASNHSGASPGYYPTKTGAFHNTNCVQSYAGTNINDNNDSSFGVGFDASRSNAIYGKSSTVQPPAYTVRYIIKAIGGGYK